MRIDAHRSRILSGILRLSLLSLVLSGLALAATMPWTPASFRGLIIGKATRADLLRLLGTPDASAHTLQGETLSYAGRGDHRGDLTCTLDASGHLSEVREAFPVSIPRTTIDREFGGDARTMRFSSARCAHGELYRDARGPLELTLYPARGVVLWPDQYGYDFAAMLYLRKTPGLARKPSCVK